MQSAWHPKDLDSLWSGNVSIVFISGPVRLYGHDLGVATPFSVPARNVFYLCGPPSSRDYCELQCYSIYMANSADTCGQTVELGEQSQILFFFLLS